MSSALASLLIGLWLVSVAAHVPYKESQEQDASFERPFVLPTDAVDAELYSSLFTSRVVRFVISKDDLYDVLEIRVQTPPETVLLLAAFNPSCEVYRGFRPSIALLGPLSDSQFPDVDPASVPFPIPDGYGAIVVEQPEDTGREVFGLGDGPGACLAAGVTFNCLVTQKCDGASIITDVELTEAGKYYAVVWDPKDLEGRDFKHDVSINIGVGESESVTAHEKSLQVAGSNLLSGLDVNDCGILKENC